MKNIYLLSLVSLTIICAILAGYYLHEKCPDCECHKIEMDLNQCIMELERSFNQIQVAPLKPLPQKMKLEWRPEK